LQRCARSVGLRFMELVLRLLTGLALAMASVQGAAALYRLPYPDGAAFMISQAPGGFISTHTTRATRNAVDFAMPRGTPVLAAREGIVIAAEWRHDSGGQRTDLIAKGNIVRVRHADGTIGNYAHFMHAGVAVEVGEAVPAGKILGYSGSTGYSSGPHLHFGVTREVRAGGTVQEVSVPLTFYIGDPPVAFAPRVGLAVTASYASPAEPPRVPERGTAPPAVALPRASLATIWAWLVAGALGLGGIAWFYRFSRS